MPLRKKQQPSYSSGFKSEIVKMVNSGRQKSEIAKEYGMAVSSITNWVNYFSQTGSFKRKDNLSDEAKELIESKKKIKYLEMEVDILKKAMAIMSEK